MMMMLTNQNSSEGVKTAVTNDIKIVGKMDNLAEMLFPLKLQKALLPSCKFDWNTV